MIGRADAQQREPPSSLKSRFCKTNFGRRKAFLQNEMG
jgi:hypothetical protein